MKELYGFGLTAPSSETKSFSKSLMDPSQAQNGGPGEASSWPAGSVAIQASPRLLCIVLSSCVVGLYRSLSRIVVFLVRFFRWVRQGGFIGSLTSQIRF